MSLDSRSWVKNAYPTQSPNSAAPAYTSKPLVSGTMTQSSEKDAIQFPGVIHAVKDSKNFTNNRTLIICLDGTGDKFDNDNSNVVNFVACLKKDNPRQVTYYQTGIGTYDKNGLSNGIDAIVDMSVGSGLGDHIKDAYRFLMQNYKEGDKICLFGFSRGAYTVRCLAGMLHKVGLLPPHNRAQVNFAYNFYKNDTEEGWRMSADFKRTFCADVSVYFVGVWDCVASVGFLPRKLPFSKSPTNNVGYFRHAIALDEHRAKFKVCQYAHQDPSIMSQKKKSNDTTTTSRKRKIFGRHSKTDNAGANENSKANKNSLLKRAMTFSSIVKPKSNIGTSESTLSKLMKPREFVPTDVLEVWFCGGHADVGGGAVHNTERHVLARIPLRWMIRQCFECNTGIIFKTAGLAETGIDIHSVWPVYKVPKRPVVGPSPTHFNKYMAGKIAPLQRRSTALGIESSKPNSSHERLSSTPEKSLGLEFPGSEKANEEVEMLPEQAEDHFDSLAPINDQLKLAKGWWLLEFWPVKIRRQREDSDEWEKVVRLNLGSYRAVRELEPNMHWTVEHRILEKGYKIKARVDRNAHWRSSHIGICNPNMVLSFILIQNRQGKTRLAKWYAPYNDEEKIKLKGEVHRLVAPRDQKYQSNFVEFRTSKIIYRRYAGLFFCACVDANDNELAYLEALHFFVEVLDSFFGNVYAILDEVFLAGEIEETSKQVVLTRLEHLDKLE
ncbi:hypothetical protein EPUL_002963, partial [Erysiphe pulchra]